MANNSSPTSFARSRCCGALVAAGLLLCEPVLCVAQSTETPVMGTVSTADAHVSGGMDVAGSTARLRSNVSVTALNHAARIALSRGGSVDVCSTSAFHLLHSGTEASLLFALDRGALEIHSIAQPRDSILTPDLRIVPAGAGEFDLRLRVTSSGDTCVENAGQGAPPLDVNDAFGTGMYRVAPGQHVLFEHGDLREVVDRETSPCGCPALPVLSAGTAAQHPFPAAESQGLSASPTAVPAPAPPGQTETQLSANLSYGEHAAPDSRAIAPAAASLASAPAAAWPPPLPAHSPGTAAATAGEASSNTPPPAPPGAHDIGHSIGNFFRRLFGGHPKS